ncbi:hypothetical protein SAMN02746041_01447 [Desulfacinum hydrothermale DSM 13146]|uniref:Flagellar protein FliT n=1 Tax=Desulfacinum hydrothermale DSM 13146 TaxID=1121390 RepID=A0A1W1XER4_9BACT|nr:hypothetical protein [Desulfacinum hydrothermale]SMC22433.1 hypothetical protein SAMN02746041_01447 [Desulfacinum hydrothermale DSM 13146]
MTSVDPLESLAGVIQELRRAVQTLQDGAEQDAEAWEMDRALRHCREAFSRLEDAVRAMDPAIARQAENRRRVWRLLEDLQGGYAACVAQCQAASRRVAGRMAVVRQGKSASAQYQKVARLKGHGSGGA